MRKTCIVFIAIVLFSAAFVSGCIQQQPQAAGESQNTDFSKLSDSQTLHLQLYFLSTKGFYLTAEMRTIQVGQGMSWAEAAVRELLRGPQKKDGKRCLPKGTTIDRVVVSNRLANVYLGGAFNTLSLRDELAARASVVNTLCSIQGIEYVGVYGGSDYPELSAPAAMRRYAGTLDELQASLKIEQETEKTSTNEWIDLPLYFMDTRGMLLLPEVRNCRVTSANLAKVVLQELIKGPANTATQQPVLSTGAAPLSDPVESVNADGTKTITINLSGQPYQDLFIVKGYEALPYAAIVYSITGAMPDVSSVAFQVNGKTVTKIGKTDIKGGRMTRKMFEDYQGQSIKLYFPNEQMDTLIPVERALNGLDANIGIEWMHALIIGPLEREDERAWPVLPSQITESDIVSVKLSEDLAIINVSKHFANVCKQKAFSLEEESILIYSIVNTMTDMPGVKRVQFLVEGETVDTLGGSINVRGPVMRNVGIIA
ncbi:MAG: GerMN domain-containing protein [Bacillota bacterium]